MTSEQRRVEVLFTSEFKRNLRRLGKRYTNIRQVVDPLVGQLEAGETPGDQVQRTGYSVYKVRLPNKDARRGKSGGYRVIYYLQAAERVVLITIYSKSDQGDVSAEAVRKIIEGHGASPTN